MRAFQCLPSVRISEVVSPDECTGGRYTCPHTGATFMLGEVAWPCYLRLPMGGIRSAEIMQHIAGNILAQALPEVRTFARPITDKRRLALGGDTIAESTAWGLYLDNLYVIGTSHAHASEVLERGVAALTHAGLLCTVTQPVARTAKLLGFQYDGIACTVGVPEERMRLLREAGLWLASCDLVDVDAVDRVLGHFTWAFLAQRPLYSVFSAIYEFVRLNRGRHVPWWGSARRELQLASRLVHLAVTTVSRPVAPLLLVTDAEGQNSFDNGGGAVVARPFPHSHATEFRNGRLWETLPGERPHASVVGFISEPGWEELDVRRWRFGAHNNVLELEAVLLAAKHIARCPGIRGRWVPLLTDSSVVLGCVRKGRSSSFALCRRLRKLAALALGWGVWLCPRWIPTDLCAADSASRRREP